jgi:hypothetical protein
MSFRYKMGGVTLDPNANTRRGVGRFLLLLNTRSLNQHQFSGLSVIIMQNRRKRTLVDDELVVCSASLQRSLTSSAAKPKNNFLCSLCKTSPPLQEYIRS